MLVEKRVQHVASSRHGLSTLAGFQEKFFCKDLQQDHIDEQYCVFIWF